MWVSWDVMTMPKNMGVLGFCDAIQPRNSCEASMVCIAQDPLSLSARILKARYFPTNDLLEAELGSHPCLGLWVLIEAISVLEQGLVRRIGIGYLRKICFVLCILGHMIHRSVCLT